MYVIYNTSYKKYFCGNHWHEDINQAKKYKNQSLANKEVLENNLLKSCKESIKILDDKGQEPKVNIQETIETLNKENADELYQDLKQGLDMIQDAMNKLNSLEKFYNSYLSENDKALTDIDHKIELERFNPFESCSLVWKRKKYLKQRRIAKDKLAYLKAIRDNKGKELVLAIEKHEHVQERRIYTPRVLKDIFKSKGVVKNETVD